jgi:hypothetical protein
MNQVAAKLNHEACALADYVAGLRLMERVLLAQF